MSQTNGVSRTGPHSVDLTIARIDDAADRLLATASALSDAQLREPALLPGWTRGHVLTHVAGNADGLRNLLAWAHTGVRTPMYPSREERDARIEAGAGRPAEEIIAELVRSGSDFTAQARELSDDAWLAEVSRLTGPPFPCWYTLHLRLAEVEIHHVDLGAGYGPADWPDWFVEKMLYEVAGRLSGDPQAPDAVVTDADTGRQFFLRPDSSAELTITGHGHELLAWLIGRTDGQGLTADPDGPLPSVPSY